MSESQPHTHLADRCLSRSRRAHEVWQQRPVGTALKCAHLSALGASTAARTNAGDESDIGDEGKGLCLESMFSYRFRTQPQPGVTLPWR